MAYIPLGVWFAHWGGLPAGIKVKSEVGGVEYGVP